MINNTRVPLIFLGTNTNIHWLVDIAVRIGYDVVGIIDDDYHGQKQFQDIPVVATQDDLISNRRIYDRYQFFCATNWQPNDVLIPAQSRNRQKRFELINLLESQQLNVATIVSPSAEVSAYQVSIGRGTLIDSFCVVSPMNKIGNYTNVYSHTNIGENTVVGDHCVLQRHVQLAGGVTLGNRVYMGFYSLANRASMHIADDTFVHPSMTVMRDTVPGEVISLAGRDLRKIYNRVVEQ